MITNYVPGEELRSSFWLPSNEGPRDKPLPSQSSTSTTKPYASALPRHNQANTSRGSSTRSRNLQHGDANGVNSSLPINQDRGLQEVTTTKIMLPHQRHKTMPCHGTSSETAAFLREEHIWVSFWRLSASSGRERKLFGKRQPGFQVPRALPRRNGIPSAVPNWQRGFLERGHFLRSFVIIWKVPSSAMQCRRPDWTSERTTDGP
ncbi:unnamed protein product, partial [Ixodes persulcatus]